MGRGQKHPSTRTIPAGWPSLPAKGDRVHGWEQLVKIKH
jgi:hypothetical protein